MYTVRVNNRLPQAYRICKAAPVAYSTARELSLFPRLISNDFAPMFRLMDDYANHISTRGGFNSSFAQSLRPFNPRFDLRETSEAYELHGEVPGVNQEDLNIEFTDAQTLSIRGRTESRREEGTQPAAAAVEGQAEQATIAAAPAEAVETQQTTADATESEAGSSETSSYHKPTVEDEANLDVAVAESTTTEAPTESSTVAQTQTAAASQTPRQQQQQQQQESDTSRYWVSERSIGTFQRSFAFPARVDQDNVRASLSNGILSIVVPKAAAPEAKRIQIQ